ncbi:hypothetical protein D0Z03_001663 [Geotrichum reessii]|nr:hypothetical protein D0Z03_001663 [Galactomyces reessii]
MDSSSLSNMYENIYIPSPATKKQSAIPVHHPTLIMQDYQTDTTHHLSCGCNSGACIEEQAWWFNTNKVEKKSTFASKRPAYKRASFSSSSSVSSFDSY